MPSIQTLSHTVWIVQEHNHCIDATYRRIGIIKASKQQCITPIWLHTIRSVQLLLTGIKSNNILRINRFIQERRLSNVVIQIQERSTLYDISYARIQL